MPRFTIANVQLNWLRLERDHCDHSIFSRSMASLSSKEAFDSDSNSDQEQSEQCGSYSLSADVSKLESCSSSFSCRWFETEHGASSSMTSSPRPVAGNLLFSMSVMQSVIGGKDMVVRDKKKPEKPETNLSSTFCFSFLLFIFSIYYLFLFSKLLLTIL